MQEGQNWAQIFYSCNKIHHLHWDHVDKEKSRSPASSSTLQFGAAACFSSRLPCRQSNCSQQRGISSSSPEAKWSPCVLAKDFTGAFLRSLHWWGLWLTLVSGSMRCPVEEGLCSRQCSFKPSSLTPHPGPWCGAGCQSLDGGTARRQRLLPFQALWATTHHPRTKGYSWLKWVFLATECLPQFYCWWSNVAPHIHQIDANLISSEDESN